MKKIFFIMTLLCCALTQTRADVILPSSTPYDPEHVYTMMNATGWYASETTKSTQDQNSAAHFAFYPATEGDGTTIENAYYIFCLESQQWLTYTKAGSYSNTRNFIQMSSSFEPDDYFYLNERTAGFYDIAPYNTSGVAGKYLNWYQGADAEHTTIGLWQQNLNEDPGSKFSFTEVDMSSDEIPYFTIQTLSRGTWQVTEGSNSWKGQTAAAEVDANDPKQQFAFVKMSGKVYLYNCGISKFISKDGSFTSFPQDGITFLYGNSIEKDKDGNTNTYDHFVICFDQDHFINHNGSKQVLIDTWGPNSPNNSTGCTDAGNCLIIKKQGTFEFINPEENNFGEELAPQYGAVDIKGIKVCAEFGKFTDVTDDQYYQTWQSNDQMNYWIGKENDQDVYSTASLVSIKTVRYAERELSYRFHYDGSDPHRVNYYLTNVGTGMVVEVAEGYNIVGYCFDYDAPNAITDCSDYEGEITSTAGRHHVEVKGLDARSTEILFGASSGDMVISNFYVFIRKGMQVTDDQFSRWSNLYFIPYAFTLAPYNKPHLQVYAPENSDILDACGADCKKYNNVEVSGEDLRQQFVFFPFDTYGINYPAYSGMYFIYSIGAKKFVSAQDGKTILTEYPLQAAQIEAGEGDYANCFRINFNKTNLLNVSTGHCKQDDATSSCVVTNWNTYDGGNHFYVRAVREFEFEAGDVMGQIYLESAYLDDQNLINEKGAEVAALLDKDGVGYPKDELRNTLTQHYNNITLYKEATSLFQLNQFLPTYKTTTDVKMPETGKAYRIKARYSNGDVRYLYRTEGGLLRMTNANTEPTNYSGTFILRNIDEAANGEGTYLFAHDSGEYMVYGADGKKGVGNSGTGFVSAYEQGENDAEITLISAADKTATHKDGTVNAGDFFGGFYLQALNGSTPYYMMGGNDTDESKMNLHSGSSADVHYSSTRSSIFYLEEVSGYPNALKLREPAKKDGKAYSSIWLPFSVEIPEGVHAYKAHIDGDQLVCGEVKNYLPAEEGAILISDEPMDIVLAPATADVAPLQDNDLKGTNVTLARNAEKTTFVLNGSDAEYGIGFFPYTGTNIAKYKAYVEVDKALAAQGLRFSFGEVTDIENTLTEGKGEEKTFYDLSGRRVAQPTKGLYIVNGKKMYIK